jgi:hypothetical protein
VLVNVLRLWCHLLLMLTTMNCAVHHHLCCIDYASMHAAKSMLQVLPELPGHVWQHVAQYLVPQYLDPRQQSIVQQLLLGGCSAAVVLDDAAQLDALQACLDVVGVVRACLHKRPLKSLEISRSKSWHQQSTMDVGSKQCSCYIMLPFQQLEQLHSLSSCGFGCVQLQLGCTAACAATTDMCHIQPAAQGRRAPTADGTAVQQQWSELSASVVPGAQLTTLKLRSCKLAAGHSWEVLAGLEQLQHLELVSVAPGDAAAATAEAAAAEAESMALAGALSTLQQLTSLKLQLTQRLNGTVVAAAGQLRKLKQMDLHRVGTLESPVCLNDLPSSIRGLKAFGCYFDSNTAAALATGGMRCLPDLQNLQVKLCVGGDIAGVVRGASSLMMLVYQVAAGELGDGAAEQLLHAAGGLAKLQHLQVSIVGLEGCPRMCGFEAADVHASITPHKVVAH